MDTPEGGYVAGGGAEAARTEEAPAATDRLVDATRAGRAEARREANELGEAESPALGQDTLQRCRRVLGPDHPATLLAAAALPLALVQLGDAEEARALAEDTLQRCQRVYGPDHPTTLYLTQTANTGRLEFDEDDAASRMMRPLVGRRERRNQPGLPRELEAIPVRCGRASPIASGPPPRAGRRGLEGHRSAHQPDVR
jgi:hypothetical protein